VGWYFLMWMQNTAHWEPGDCYSRLLCCWLHKNTQTHTLVGKSLKVTRRIQFMSPKKLTHFDLRSTPAQTAYTQWLLGIPISVKLLPTLVWSAVFRNTRHWGVPRGTREGHSFLQRFSAGQNSTPFLHESEHIQSGKPKAVPQSDFGVST
jgi:hypothetical protein